MWHSLTGENQLSFDQRCSFFLSETFDTRLYSTILVFVSDFVAGLFLTLKQHVGIDYKQTKQCAQEWTAHYDHSWLPSPWAAQFLSFQLDLDLTSRGLCISLYSSAHHVWYKFVLKFASLGANLLLWDRDRDDLGWEGRMWWVLGGGGDGPKGILHTKWGILKFDVFKSYAQCLHCIHHLYTAFILLFYLISYYNYTQNKSRML